MSEQTAAGRATTPTPKMVDYARKIAVAMDRKLTDEVTGSFDACKDFIDENKHILDIPTEKQLKFAERIATDIGVALPDELRADRRGLSAWIDANKPAA